MHIRKLLAIVLLSSGSLFAQGQINMSGMEPLSTDSLQKNRIRYFSPGSGGKNKVWDFSRKLSSKESSQIMFMKDSTNMISVVESGRTCYYNTTPDTLVLCGSESSLEKRTFLANKAIRKFPLVFCDSISNQFRSEGTYCGNHPFREEGSTRVKVDAEGCMILAENDTIYNVKRVHTIDTYSICMDLNTAALDTAKLTQVIDERYEWYLPESQYPIIENVTSTTYLNMDAIGTTKYAFCNLPADRAALYITESDGYEADEEYNGFDDVTNEQDIIHYHIENHGNIINITYDLDEDATINTIIANHMGMPFRYKEWTQRAGQGYTRQIDCSGLRSGIYILYINVNGKSYSEKVTIN